MIDLTTFERLLTPDGTRALAAATELAPTDATVLAHVSRLRKHFPADIATAALETVLLRRKATIKFSRADRMFFTREGLEVSSGEAVSRYRAERFRRFESVADLGCGIGGDAIGLASVSSWLTAVDQDQLRVRMAEANLAAYDIGGRVEPVVADLLTAPPPRTAAAFADPGRRAGGKRFLSLADYLPPPADLLRRLPCGYPIGFKLAPGLSLDELTPFDGEVEFISVSGELKECVLWLGELRTTQRRATLLTPGGIETLHADLLPGLGELGPIAAYLYDPDPAVIRAGLVPVLGERLGAARVDATVRTLTRAEHAPTPFATAYLVDAVVPADEKKVLAALRERNVGRITPVNRGWPGELPPVDRWKLTGTDHRFVLFTRELSRPVAVVGERV